MNEIYTDEKQAPIRANLTYYLDGELVSAWQDFPTTREEMEYNLERSGIEAEHLTGILDTKYETTVSALGHSLPTKPDLNELNELAHRLAGMDNEELATFGCALEAGLHRGSMTKLLNLTLNLEHFDFYPGHFTTKDFGGIMRETHANVHWEVMERLQASDSPEERAFASYVERLEQSVDLEKYAPLAQQADGGILTRSGYLVPLTDELPQRYSGPQDIPAEHRLSEPPAALAHRPSLLEAVAEKKAEQAARDVLEEDCAAKTPCGPEL